MPNKLIYSDSLYPTNSYVKKRHVIINIFSSIYVLIIIYALSFTLMLIIKNTTYLITCL